MLTHYTKSPDGPQVEVIGGSLVATEHRRPILRARAGRAGRRERWQGSGAGRGRSTGGHQRPSSGHDRAANTLNIPPRSPVLRAYVLPWVPPPAAGIAPMCGVPPWGYWLTVGSPAGRGLKLRCYPHREQASNRPRCEAGAAACREDSRFSRMAVGLPHSNRASFSSHQASVPLRASLS